MSPIPLGIFAASGAGAPAGDFELIETILITSANSGSITFQSIPQTYKHLQVRFLVRESGTGTSATTFRMQFNNNANNYAWHRLNGTGSAVISEAGSATTAIILNDSIVQGNAAANIFTAGIIDILDYSATNKNKVARALTGTAFSGENDINLFSGLWANTNSITILNLGAASGNNLAVGSRFSLYGIKG